MNKILSKFRFFCVSSFRVGWFLAVRQIRYNSKWTTGLIILIMMLTFLNLVFVSGILSGLVEGSSLAYRHQYSADLILSNLESEPFIKNTQNVIDILYSFPEVVAVSPRILVSGVVEANYKNKKKPTDPGDELGVKVAGIDPVSEHEVTQFDDLLIDGDYLYADDENEILIGSNLLANYSRDVPGDETIENVGVGDTVRLKIGETVKEFRVKGVIKSKIGEVGRRVFVSRKYLRKIINRPGFNVNEISVLLRDNVDPYAVKRDLARTDICGCAKIETWQESQGQFFKDISATFNGLGVMIGSIGLVVASITVFIVIFINAITRKKFIGILKGIGVCGLSIEISYVLQSLFYALAGSAFGFLLIYGVLKPYIDKNPIDFPFSDGILLVPLEQTVIKFIVLFFITLLAGYLPARMIINKNTLDSILGR